MHYDFLYVSQNPYNKYVGGRQSAFTKMVITLLKMNEIDT